MVRVLGDCRALARFSEILAALVFGGEAFIRTNLVGRIGPIYAGRRRPGPYVNWRAALSIRTAAMAFRASSTGTSKTEALKTSPPTCEAANDSRRYA